MQAATLFYTAVIFSQVTYTYKPGDHSPNHHCHQNLKFHTGVGKGKGKTVSVHALKVCKGSRGIAPLILNSALVRG